MKYYVYMLLDPNTYQPFYVGKGSADRINFHYGEARRWISAGRPEDKSTAKLKLIASLIDQNKEPINIKLYKKLTEDQALMYEKEVISKIGLDKLTNVSSGGQYGWSNNWTEDQKKKFSEKHKENYRKGRVNPMLGKSRPDLANRNKANGKKVFKMDLKGNLIDTFDNGKIARTIDKIQYNYIGEDCLPVNGYFYRYSTDIPNREKLIQARLDKDNTPLKRDVILKCDAENNIVSSYFSIKDAARQENISYHSLWLYIKSGKEFHGYFWKKG